MSARIPEPPSGGEDGPAEDGKPFARRAVAQPGEDEEDESDPMITLRKNDLMKLLPHLDSEGKDLLDDLPRDGHARRARAQVVGEADQGPGEGPAAPAQPRSVLDAECAAQGAA